MTENKSNPENKKSLETVLKTVLIVQCRLSSSRLPDKALLPLGNKKVIDWNLSAMKKVPADEYWLATDETSYDKLSPFARENGFEIFKGPLDDVLERFCLLIEKTGADTVIRATADNPFLFYDAATSLLEEWNKKSAKEKIDYMTYTGLPHGSGVEVFSGKSLLAARDKTYDPYDHEHAGPAIYRHPESFKSLFVPAPKKWRKPDLRTTIDTAADYMRAKKIVAELSADGKNGSDFPFESAKIIKILESGKIPPAILCVPCVKKGKGTGHLRRCLSIALSTGAAVYIPDDAGLEEKDELISEAMAGGLEPVQITNVMPQKGDYSLILTDAFTLDREMAEKLSSAAPLAAIDEGSLNTDLCDYLLDIIPSYGIARPSNLSDPAFVTLPKNKRSLPPLKSSSDIQKILVTVGGEDPADLVVPSAIALASTEKNVTAIVSDPENALSRVSDEVKKYITFIKPVHNLREQLFQYDLVVTHYGFTAFEALAAGCAVILLGTTKLHIQLAQKYGFSYLAPEDISAQNFEKLMENPGRLYPPSFFASKGGGACAKDLEAFASALARGKRLYCPICRESHLPTEDLIVSRIPGRTFRRCKTCGMLYMAWSEDPESTKYNEAYFFDSYKKQYGKTYLDDFTAIKAQCIRRHSIVDYIFRGGHKAVTPAVLDIGCAFGPYLDAAADSGWQVYGTDISKEAVSYVQNTLKYPAACAAFPDFDAMQEFGVSSFDAVTMWYVIEHFRDLDGVLKAVAKNLKKGGIFAFSTPSASGVSGKFNTQSFFLHSPADHFSLWEPGRADSILRRYGFKVVKVVSTGHHPERFPSLAKKGIKPNGLKFALFTAASHFFGLGDTFEVYCKKI